MVKQLSSYINFKSIIIILFVLFLSSCKTQKIVTQTDIVRPISTSKLVRNIESNEFDYKHLAIKKMSCEFDNGKSKTTFRASVWAEKNKSIVIMITKLNITVARVWLSPDSVKLINYMDKTYFLDNYSYLSSELNLDLDFDMIQSVLAGNIFSVTNAKRDRDMKDFKNNIESGLFVLQMENDGKNKKNISRTLDKKPTKKTNKLVENEHISQSIYINPETFKVVRILMEDKFNARKLNIAFSGFIELEKKLYPEELLVVLVSPESNMQMKVSMSGFSLKNEKEFKFRIPEKYTRLNTN